MEILIVGAVAVLAAAVAWGMRGRLGALAPAQKGLVGAPPTRRPRGDIHADDGREAAPPAPAHQAH